MMNAKLVDAVKKLIAHWDQHGAEVFITDGMYGRYDPAVRMVDSRFIAELRAALALAEPRK